MRFDLEFDQFESQVFLKKLRKYCFNLSGTNPETRATEFFKLAPKTMQNHA
jgi:hypothetical protein